MSKNILSNIERDFKNRVFGEISLSSEGKRKETDRFKSFPYDELMHRDKVNLDIFWLKDESLGDSENLPSPAVIAAEIVENLETALEQFSGIAGGLRGN